MVKKTKKPDAFATHEALHMASFLAHSVHAELCAHAAVKSRKKWHRLALKAEAILCDLYLSIATNHH
jgi:hypothetical protein